MLKSAFKRPVTFACVSGCLALLFVFSSHFNSARADAPALIPVKLLLDWYPQAEHGGYICAFATGLYKQAGLDVSVCPVNPAASGEVPVASGTFDIGLSTANAVMLAREKGIPLLAVMATMQHDPQAIMVHDESPIHSFSDLSGHKVAFPPFSAGFKWIMKKYNLTNIQQLRPTFNTAVFVSDPDYVQEIFVTSEPYFASLKGCKTRSLSYSDAGVQSYRVLVTSETFATQHPDVMKKFVAASIQGWDDYLTKADSQTITDAKIKEMNPAMTQGQIDFSRNVLITQHFIHDPAKGEFTGRMTPERWLASKKILTDVDLLPTDFDVTKAYSLDFLPRPRHPTSLSNDPDRTPSQTPHLASTSACAWRELRFSTAPR